MFTWHDNGTLDISLGNVILSGGYPAVDDVPLRPLRVYVKKGGAFFELEEGTLSLQVREEEEGRGGQWGWRSRRRSLSSPGEAGRANEKHMPPTV